MGVFDQNGGRLPAAGQPMGAPTAPQADLRQPTAAQQMPMGAASQITAPRMVDQNLMPPGAATPMPAPQGQPMPPQMGQRPYAPLNFGGMGRLQQPPGLGGMTPQRPDMPQRPMPPQAMGGMAPGNFDPQQIPAGGMMNHQAMNFMPPEGRARMQDAHQRIQSYLAANGSLPPLGPGVDRNAAMAGYRAMGIDPDKYGGLREGGGGGSRPQMLAQALMNRR